MKYRFEITYQNKYVKKASDFLNKCDLGVGEFGIKEIMTFTSTKDLLISNVKDLIKEAYQTCECEVLLIEGGK